MGIMVYSLLWVMQEFGGVVPDLWYLEEGFQEELKLEKHPHSP